MSRRSVNCKAIYPHGGDRRGAFEELTSHLFCREYRRDGIFVRREGAGGDEGLEATIIDKSSRVLIGLQSKYFVSKMDSTQWRDLNNSIQTALQHNAADRALRKIVISLPKNLTPTQHKRYSNLQVEWQTHAKALGFPHKIEFLLWSETSIRDLLLQNENRGLLLHYFEYPDFDVSRCREKTLATIRNLGDRYQPDLHTPTDAEDILHTFLRTERFKQQYLEFFREKIHTKQRSMRGPGKDWPTMAIQQYEAAEQSWQQVLPFFQDGFALPSSFEDLEKILDNAFDAVISFLNEIHKAIPPKKNAGEYTYQSRSPIEDAYYGGDRWAGTLRDMSGFARRHSQADKQFLLLEGKPGTGKTQVLAEICRKYASCDGAVLFVEGGIFTNAEPPWNQLLKMWDFPGKNLREFLDLFSAIGFTTGLPALICIDALNETPSRDMWRQNLENFASELLPFKNVRLLVSCRSDYLRQTIPEHISNNKAGGWCRAEHLGLGVKVFEALPKFFKAYDVKGVGIPPLTMEFRNPLFLKTYCEAYAGKKPDTGSMSLAVILKQYSRRKADFIGQRIDCEKRRIWDALREFAQTIGEQQNLRIPERLAQSICEKHHPPSEPSKSLYRALLAEGILAEIPREDDILGTTHDVRFTYERVWDYFLSMSLMPRNRRPSKALLKQLADQSWRTQNSGVFSMLTIRYAEEFGGELSDQFSSESLEWDICETLVNTFPWRRKENITERTKKLFRQGVVDGWIRDEFDFLLSLAPNLEHPWNADALHAGLTRLPMAKRDQEWTLWVNQSLTELNSHSSLAELLNWAERGALEQLPDDQLFLLGTALAWCLTTTVPTSRQQVSLALGRLIFARPLVAARLVDRFLSVDDSYVKEKILLAAAGSAQQAPNGDEGLRALAVITYGHIFSSAAVEPNVLIRHYASEICQQALSKGVLPKQIPSKSFLPPYRSKWPQIWTERQFNQKRKSSAKAGSLFRSIEPGPGIGYGDWGRYVMEGAVHQFQSKRLRQPPPGKRNLFDQQIAKRFIAQRVFAIGWNPAAVDHFPNNHYLRGESAVERLSKKYQWIALYELLGHLCDHFHFSDYEDTSIPFSSARQLRLRHLEDPFIIEPPAEPTDRSWQFRPSGAPWWKAGVNIFSSHLGLDGQRRVVSERNCSDPIRLLRVQREGQDWITLSGFLGWKEPLPVWKHCDHDSYMSEEWAFRSYLTPVKDTKKLATHFSHPFVDRMKSHFWLDEPSFSRPFVELRTYPSGQTMLRERCLLKNFWEIENWTADGYCTTCQCDNRENSRHKASGSIPSPFLAEIGQLRWLNSDFDFGCPSEEGAVMCHMGKDFEGSCLVRFELLLKWLKEKQLSIVWRIYGRKYLYNDDNRSIVSSRAYWTAYYLDPRSTNIVCHGGATCEFPNGAGPEEPLPWIESKKMTIKV